MALDVYADLFDDDLDDVADSLDAAIKAAAARCHADDGLATVEGGVHD